MPLYDYTLKDGRTVTLYRPMSRADEPVTGAELADNGYPDAPSTALIPSRRHTVPDRVALAQFKSNPHSQPNQVLAGYRKMEEQGKLKSRFTAEQVKQAWATEAPADPVLANT